MIVSKTDAVSFVENCWSKLKSILRTIGARTDPDVAKAIDKSRGLIILSPYITPYPER